MVVSAVLATSPWWFTPAVNTIGIGSLMLHDYIRNRGLSSPRMKTSSAEENWLNTGEFESPDSYINKFVPNTTAGREVEFEAVPEVKTENKFGWYPPNNNNKGGKNKNNDPNDPFMKGARRYLNVEGLVSALMNMRQGNQEQAIAQPPSVESTNTLSPKDQWLADTANSPAQQSGAWNTPEGKDQLWKTHLANQQWRKDKGRSFSHGDLLN